MIHTQQQTRAKLEAHIRKLVKGAPADKMGLIGSSSKMMLGLNANYLCGVVYMQPHSTGGLGTMCPMSTQQCREACLVNSGRMLGGQAYDGRQW